MNSIDAVPSKTEEQEDEEEDLKGENNPRGNTPPKPKNSVAERLRAFSDLAPRAWGPTATSKCMRWACKLRPFEDWKKLIAPIASHRTGAWLRREYNTAVIRATKAQTGKTS